MPKIKDKFNIARVIYNAYSHADLLPIVPKQDCRTLDTLLAKVTHGDIGDGLFKFIVTEIAEGGEGKTTGAILVMEQARKDVEAVLLALEGNVN